VEVATKNGGVSMKRWCTHACCEFDKHHHDGQVGRDIKVVKEKS
jgi:hypothetical protein